MARVAKKGYFINPIVQKWLETNNVNQCDFALKAGISGSYLSSALQQKAHVGTKKRPGILRELSKLFGREVEFDEIFSAEEYAVEGKGKLWGIV